MARKYIKWKKETGKSLKEWAEIYGVSTPTIRSWSREKCNGKRWIPPEKPPLKENFIWGRETGKNVSDWAEFYGVAEDTLRKWSYIIVEGKRWMPPGDPPRKGVYMDWKKETGRTITEWAEFHKVSKQAISQWQRSGWAPSEFRPNKRQYRKRNKS